jgi:hypothetical protein
VRGIVLWSGPAFSSLKTSRLSCLGVLLIGSQVFGWTLDAWKTPSAFPSQGALSQYLGLPSPHHVFSSAFVLSQYQGLHFDSF